MRTHKLFLTFAILSGLALGVRAQEKAPALQPADGPWYIGIGGGTSFGQATFYSITEEGIRRWGLQGGLFGGYRFNRLVSLEAGLQMGGQSQFNLDCCRHIIELSNMELSVNCLIDCDVVITDYSSIMFDGYLLGKPAVLFEKKPGYLQTRGMYMQYPDKYCSRYATDESDLLWQVRSADGLTKTERDCMEYVAGCCDGHSIERIIKLIKEVQECRGSFVI